jgi:PAS domain S-box-containing protein
LLNGKSIEIPEHIYIQQSGKRLHIKSKAFSFFNDSHEFQNYVIQQENLTEVRNQEKKLKQSEEKYRSLVEHMPDVFWKIRSDGDIFYFSPNIKKMLGYSPEEITSKEISWTDILHPEDKLKSVEKFHLLFEENKPLDLEHRYKKLSGDYLWVHERSLGTYKQDGKIIADGIITDISQRKNAELKIKE